jgi:hypothetical protein
MWKNKALTKVSASAICLSIFLAPYAANACPRCEEKARANKAPVYAKTPGQRAMERNRTKQVVRQPRYPGYRRQGAPIPFGGAPVTPGGNPSAPSDFRNNSYVGHGGFGR